MPTRDFDLAHTYLGTPFTEPIAPATTILGYLAERVATHPDDPFVTTVDPRVTLTYRDLDLASRRMASWLLASGITPGDVVAYGPRNDVRSIVTVVALLRAGCPTLLVNPADPAARTRQQTDAIGAGHVLGTLPDVASLTGDPTDTDATIDPLADALYFGTSGSTAASKIVAQSYYNAAVNAHGIGRHHRLRRGDRILGCLPIHHVNGLHLTVFGTIAAGAHLVLAPAFDPFGYVRLLDEFRPRIASVVPSILEAVQQTWRRPMPPAGLEYFISAAAPLSARTAAAVTRRVGVPVMQGYGLTETTNFSTTMPVDLPAEAYRTLMIDTDIPSVGRAIHGNEVAVLAPDGSPVPAGEIGEVCMRGHNVMTGYAGSAQATAEAFQGGWFHSQDLGYEVQGGFFVLTGRLKNIAKVGGEAVSLDELDRVLKALPEVTDAAAVALPHRFLGEEVVAAVVLASGAVDDVRMRLKGSFAEHLLPTRVVELDAIPRTPTGKVLRPQLAKRLTG